MNTFALADSIGFFCGFLMATLGACFGSFAALIIWRLPRGHSIVTPRSFCPACQKPLRVLHNIPIISFIFLRGRCHFCHAPIGLRTLVIEIIFSIALLSLYLKFGFHPAMVERFCFVFILVCLLYIDIDTFSLPYSLLFALILLGIVSSAYFFFNENAYRAPSESLLSTLMVIRKTSFSLLDRVWGALIGGGFLAAVNLLGTWLLRKSGRLLDTQWAMGWGDPILLFGIGMIVGLSHLVMVIFLAGAIGTLAGVVMNFFDRQKHADIAEGAIPFGPFLAIAALYTYLF